MTNGIAVVPFVIRHFAFFEMVTHRQRDDAFRPRQHFLWIHALICIALEVTHFAVPALCQPVFKISGMVGWMRAGETAVVESEFTRALTDGFFHRCAA